MKALFFVPGRLEFLSRCKPTNTIETFYNQCFRLFDQFKIKFPMFQIHILYQYFHLIA
jgi:hypothetical protein